MNLYLIQHGEAVNETVDPARPLSERGVREVKAMGEFVGSLGLDLAEVWHSGKTRARQTAQHLLPHIAPRGHLVVKEGLNPNDTPRGTARELEDRKQDLAIVGHLPHLSRLASLLLVEDENAEVVAFRQGGIVALHRDESGKRRLRWMVTPELLLR